MTSSKTIEVMAHALCPFTDELDGPCMKCPQDEVGPNGGRRGCMWINAKAADAILSALQAEGMAVVANRCLIPLTNGGFTLVSEEDAERVLAAGAWFSVPKDGNNYACRSFGRDNRIYLHRFIMEPETTNPIDHIDGNTMDNRRSNLRIASPSENGRNRARPQTNNKSGVRGVHWNKHKKKWDAQIRHNGKKVWLGLFSDLEEARKARIAFEEANWSAADRHRAIAAQTEEKDHV